jgi:predicted ATPase
MPERADEHSLRSWSLSGFRSIRDRTTLNLGGLNLLIGANSAGKSSVLHSLLMAAQTLGNPLADRPLVLNGPLVRLGLAEDTIHEESRRTIELGFELVPSPEGRRPATRRAHFARLHADARFTMATAGVEFELEECTVAAEPDDPEQPLQEIRIRRRSQTAAAAALRLAGLKGQQVRDLASLIPYDAEGTTAPRTAGARVRQFLPETLATVVNAYEEELERLRWPFLRYGVGPEPTTLRRAQQEPVSRPVLNFIRDFLAEAHGEEIASNVPKRGRISGIDLYDRLPPEAIQAVQDVATTGWFVEHRDRLPFQGQMQAVPLPDALNTGIDYARHWFATSVRHLGPLRAAPQPLYGLPEAASGTSVGRNGEYTAAVLSAHARRLVRSPSPRDGRLQTIPLSQAVDDWMSAMNLLSSVRSQERGKLGYELHLRVEGMSRDLDLTTVGVGVSQALPIIVLGLIVPPGSLLLFEQPELHLHPDVQAALGDFFLALARSGRQLLVETHSEYLVNRLRRRAATDSDSNVEELVRLFFFERRGSTSKIAAGRIGQGGSMPDWPRGFLDTAAREVEAIAGARRAAATGANAGRV